nr:MAG TPA_asm: hypothetical protein [Bacteriophage sp.]
MYILIAILLEQMHFFGILGIIQKMERVYIFYIQLKLQVQIIHLLKLIQLYIIFYQYDASIKYNTISVKSKNHIKFDFDNSNANHSIYIIGIYTNISNCIPIFSDEYQESHSDINGDLVETIIINYYPYIVNNGKFTLSIVSGEFTVFYYILN